MEVKLIHATESAWAKWPKLYRVSLSHLSVIYIA